MSTDDERTIARKVVQLIPWYVDGLKGAGFLALADDGTVWRLAGHPPDPLHWEQLPALPPRPY